MSIVYRALAAAAVAMLGSAQIGDFARIMDTGPGLPRHRSPGDRAHKRWKRARSK